MPSPRRIYTKDYDQDDQKLIETLSSPVNASFESLYEALNGRLTFSDNLQSVIRDIQIVVDAFGNPKTTTSFALSSTDRISGTVVIFAQNLTNSNTYPTNTPFISFSQSGNKIIINNITGLSANDSWLIRVITIN